MIIDLITGKTYKSEKCWHCGCEEIYVCHAVNPMFPNDIDKDDVFCRCNNCRYIPKENRWDSPTKHFNNVQEAVDFWNEKNEW
jgi:hypothetical protein